MDSRSEQYIQKTIQQLRNEKKTIVLIAHRLSTVVQADEVMVLEKGKLVEKGNHEDLLRQKGFYYAIHTGGNSKNAKKKIYTDNFMGVKINPVRMLPLEKW